MHRQMATDLNLKVWTISLTMLIYLISNLIWIKACKDHLLATMAPSGGGAGINTKDTMFREVVEEAEIDLESRLNLKSTCLTTTYPKSTLTTPIYGWLSRCLCRSLPTLLWLQIILIHQLTRHLTSQIKNKIRFMRMAWTIALPMVSISLLSLPIERIIIKIYYRANLNLEQIDQKSKLGLPQLITLVLEVWSKITYPSMET